jgi:hypothetical protein
MADKRISGLPAISSAAREDLLLVVDDPAGTPSNKKVSLTQFFSNVEPEIVFANTKALVSSTNAAVIFKGGVAIQDSMKVDTDLTVNVTATLNIATINSLSSALIGTTNAIYDLGNTTIGWGNAYVGIIKGDTDDNLLITANTNASANIIFTGANVHIKSNSIVAGTNTVITSNATFTGANVVISGTNSHVTSNTTIAGTNSVFSANATFTGANVVISGTNTHVTSNSTLAGTNTVVSSNATFSANVAIAGDNVYITSNSTFVGTDATITANITMAGTNTHITSENLYSSANATLEGTLTTITSNVSATANVSLTSVIDSSTNTTGALTVAGGVGISKSCWVGENLNVHGNIHANGNITADGGTITLGDSDADTVTFNADIGSDLLPDVDSSFDFGNTTHRFANAYIDDITVTGNVDVAGAVAATGNVSAAFGSFSDNVSIGTDKSLIFRDATLEINSPVDGELELASDDLITLTATANVEIDSAVFNVASNSTIAGTNTVINSNVTISGANTVIASANVNLTGAGATIDGTLMNVKSNVVMSGITTLGVDGSGKNFTLYSSTAGNKLRLKALTDQFVSNTQIESSEKIRTDGHVFVSNDSSLVFGSQFKIMDTASTTGFLLQEDGTAAGSGTEGGRVDLETAEEAKLTHNSTAGFGFSDNLDITGNVSASALISSDSLNVTSTTDSTSTITGSIKTVGGLGVAKSAWFGDSVYTQTSLALAGATLTAGYVGDGAGIFAIKNGTAPTAQGADQAYLYAKDDVSESHIYTMDEGGNETKLGPHNENDEWEFYSRNVKTGKVIRVNMERMIRKLEKFTGDTFIEEN